MVVQPSLSRFQFCSGPLIPETRSSNGSVLILVFGSFVNFNILCRFWGNITSLENLDYLVLENVLLGRSDRNLYQQLSLKALLLKITQCKAAVLNDILLSPHIRAVAVETLDDDKVIFLHHFAMSALKH